jgi:hypothetical protein
MGLTKPTPAQIKTQHPDPLKHKYISFAKSGLRILAGGLLCTGQLFAAGAFLILAEVLGVAEELV